MWALNTRSVAGSLFAWRRERTASADVGEVRHTPSGCGCWCTSSQNPLCRLAGKPPAIIRSCTDLMVQVDHLAGLFLERDAALHDRGKTLVEISGLELRIGNDLVNSTLRLPSRLRRPFPNCKAVKASWTCCSSLVDSLAAYCLSLNLTVCFITRWSSYALVADPNPCHSLKECVRSRGRSRRTGP